MLSNHTATVGQEEASEIGLTGPVIITHPVIERERERP